eukprot:gene9259-biopygen2081
MHSHPRTGSASHSGRVRGPCPYSPTPSSTRNRDGAATSLHPAPPTADRTPAHSYDTEGSRTLKTGEDEAAALGQHSPQPAERERRGGPGDVHRPGGDRAVRVARRHREPREVAGVDQLHRRLRGGDEDVPPARQPRGPVREAVGGVPRADDEAAPERDAGARARVVDRRLAQRLQRAVRPAAGGCDRRRQVKTKAAEDSVFHCVCVQLRSAFAVLRPALRILRSAFGCVLRSGSCVPRSGSCVRGRLSSSRSAALCVQLRSANIADGLRVGARGERLQRRAAPLAQPPGRRQ